MADTKKCMIIAAAPIIDESVFEEFNPENYYVICADGGYKTAVKYGITPDYTVGDFDSLKTPPTPVNGNVRKLPKEKDLTDTMYAALIGLKMGYKHFVMLGCASGDRLDHTLANYNVMLYLVRKGCSVVMADEFSKTFLLNGSRLRVREQKNSLVSVFPFGSNMCQLTYHGLKYPLEAKELMMGDTLMGVSNEIVTDDAEIIVHSGFALIIIYN